MRTVQEIFRTVINHRHYAVSTKRSEFMCWALCHALMTHDISLDEFCAARRAIDEYLDELGAPPGGLMYEALQRIGACPEDMSARVWALEGGKVFYSNWDERPRKEGSMSVNIQEVFNKVIDAGLYWGYEDCEQFMCHALRAALRRHIITRAEHAAAKEAIWEYMLSIDPLAHALVGALRRKLGHALTTPAMREGNLTELYRDWANRPMPKPLHSQPEIHLY